MPLFLLVSCAEPAPGLTIDMFDADYAGAPNEDDLLPAVRVVDQDSSLTIAFYTKEDVLWAKATFEGEIRKGLITLVGPETDYIEGVTVDGEQLECVYVVSGVALEVTGVFSVDHESLVLSIEELGEIQLERVMVDATGS